MSPGCIAGFFPTVAWPSEAVRVCDDSIKFIQKRVEAPFYGPRGIPDPIRAQTQRPTGAWLNRPTAGAGWLTGVKRNRIDTFHDGMMQTDCTWVLLIPTPQRGIIRWPRAKRSAALSESFFQP